MAPYFAKYIAADVDETETQQIKAVKAMGKEGFKKFLANGDFQECSAVSADQGGDLTQVAAVLPSLDNFPLREN